MQNYGQSLRAFGKTESVAGHSKALSVTHETRNLIKMEAQPYTRSVVRKYACYY